MVTAAAPTSASKAGAAGGASRPRAVLQRKCACGVETHGTGECDACRRKRERGLHRAAVAPGLAGTAAPPIVREVLDRPGAPLDRGTRAAMERQFGYDFGRVRVHADARAAESAAAVRAHAYTVGSHVVLAGGRYRPAEPEGRRLLAHELAHVVQQGDRDPGDELVVSDDAAAERAAESAGARVAAGGRAPALGPIAAPRVQREEAPPGAAPAPQVSLSWTEEAVISVAAGTLGSFSSAARRMIGALLRGVLLEVKAQIAAGKGQELQDRVLETFRSPTRVAVFVLHYWWGLVKGIFSPITGLFDLALMANQLRQLQMTIMANAWRRRGELGEDLEQLAIGYLGMKQKFDAAVDSLLARPVEAAQAFMTWLDRTGKDVEAAAERGGHAVGAALMAQLGKPVEQLGEMAGRIVGEVLINVVLFVFTSGIGNAIAQVASRLGELGALLGRFGRIAEALGTLAAKLGEALTVVGSWITRAEQTIAEVAGVLLRPLKPVLDEVGGMMSRFRTFLRKLLGVAEEEAVLLGERAVQTGAGQLGSKAPPVAAPPKAPSVAAVPKAPAAPAPAPSKLQAVPGVGKPTGGPGAAGKLRSIPGGKASAPSTPAVKPAPPASPAAAVDTAPKGPMRGALPGGRTGPAKPTGELEGLPDARPTAPAAPSAPTLSSDPAPLRPTGTHGGALPAQRPAPRLVPAPEPTPAAVPEAKAPPVPQPAPTPQPQSAPQPLPLPWSRGRRKDRQPPAVYPLCWPVKLLPPGTMYFVRIKGAPRDDDEMKQARMMLYWRQYRDPSFDPAQLHVHHMTPLFLGGADDLSPGGNGIVLWKTQHLMGHAELKTQPQMTTPSGGLPPLPTDIYKHPAGTRYVLAGFKTREEATCGPL